MDMFVHNRYLNGLNDSSIPLYPCIIVHDRVGIARILLFCTKQAYEVHDQTASYVLLLVSSEFCSNEDEIDYRCRNNI